MIPPVPGEALVANYWSASPDHLLHALGASELGLTDVEARARLVRFGPNQLRPRRRSGWLSLLLAQFASPVILLLLFAAALAAMLGQHGDTSIILVIVIGSGLLGFWQEHGAARAVEALLARVRVLATLRRNGAPVDLPLEEVVPGDIVELTAGDVIPADSRLLESRDLYVDEAALTGETYPVEKAPAVLPPETPLEQRSNSLFLGTHVVSGTGLAVVARTGRGTEFSLITQHMSLGRTETEFERGVRRFGYFLMEVTLVLVIAIFAINVYLAHPVIDSFLFSLALAVGLTPQLLPAIISINLAHGARRMADRRVIVKRLASIENFGSMDVLCSDKTGTLTEGTVRIRSIEDFEGKPSDRARLYAFLNAHFETGFANPIDEAIRADQPLDVSAFQKLDEVPYDFLRKRLSVLVANQGRRLLLTKGALPNVLAACDWAESAMGHVVPLDDVRASIEKRFQSLGGEGYRVLGVAYRDVAGEVRLSALDEVGLTFAGFIVLHDPLKGGIAETVARLGELGVRLKVITGDNRHVAETVGRLVGLCRSNVLTGEDVRNMSDAALVRSVESTTIFSEIEPNQKERILLALRRAGNVVGYLGDGINDAPALHAADVGISVNTAVDVAKEAADIVLLEKDLAVLAEGVREGRITFANTLKYVYIATSANFGNMFSMAGASLFLSYLPLLPKQVLLLNLMTDLPEMAIAADRVDEDLIAQPRRWDIQSIRRFMIVFGTISSVFDYATFLVLLVLGVSPTLFRSAWFVESLVSACLIVLVVRTSKPFFASRPGQALEWGTIVVAVSALVLPYTFLGPLMGFTSPPFSLLLVLGAIVALYVATAEVVKQRYFWHGSSR